MLAINMFIITNTIAISIIIIIIIIIMIIITININIILITHTIIIIIIINIIITTIIIITSFARASGAAHTLFGRTGRRSKPTSMASMLREGLILSPTSIIVFS